MGAEPSPLVTLTTDFGGQDWYVGALRGAILRRCPLARLVDICHEILPQDVAGAAEVVRLACPEFPLETVHVVVVDPGVGTGRTPVLVRAGDMWWVGPDNGVLGPVCDQLGLQDVYAIENRDICAPKISQTFHGRDVFGPIAGFIAAGGDPQEVGSETTLEGGFLARALVGCGPDRVEGKVVAVDRFGNLVTNISADQLPGGDVEVQLPGGKACALVETYGEAEPGTVVALVGSSDRLEVAVVNGHAGEKLQLSVGAPIVVRVRP